MKKLLGIIVLGLLLQGCAPILDASSPAQVVIRNCMINNQAAALATAQAHCEGYDKNAVKQPDDRPDGLCYYECKAK
jgi:hypothetical protein